jgi:MFS family permease
MSLHHHVSLFGRKMRGSLYELNFLVNLSMALMSFYLSAFAESIGISGIMLGVLFAFGSGLSIASFTTIKQITERLGIHKALVLASTAYAIGLALVTFATSFSTLLVPFILTTVSSGLIVCFLDMYVTENTMHTHVTGEVRGLYLAASNFAYITGPLAGGFLVDIGGYRSLFFTAAICMVPFLAIIYTRLPNIRSLEKEHHHSVLAALKKIRTTVQLREVFIAQALYRIFAAVSVTYLSIFLNKEVGLVMALVGVVLMVMEIPYVLVEIPLGKLIDGRWSERTPSMVGFFILGVTTFMIPFAQTDSVVFWALLLFVSRIGGAIIEVCLESYFFKHVQGTDQEEVAAFRALYPLTFIIGPIAASILLAVGGFMALFLVLSMVMVYGVFVSYSLEA